MKRRVSVAFVILVIALCAIFVGNTLVFQSHKAMAGKQIAYKVIEAGGNKLGNPQHVERLLNVMAQEGWEYVDVLPMTDLFIFKK